MSSDRDHMRGYMRERWQRRRAAALVQLGAVCKVCGTTHDLQFDHVDPTTKLFGIARGSSFSEERFQAELKKFQLLCGFHHREKTSREHKTRVRNSEAEYPVFTRRVEISKFSGPTN